MEFLIMNVNHSVKEICEILHISEAFLYKLWRLNVGPTVTKIGRRTFVTDKALTEWQQRMEKQQRGGITNV